MHGRLLGLGFASFLAFGTVLVLLGANQAELARDLGLDWTRTGMLASALAGGLGVGVVVAGPLVDRLPRRPLYLASMAASAAALLSFDAEMGFPRALASCAALGFGAGLYDTLVSALVSERFGSEAARPMSAVHAAAPLGALLCPFLAAALAERAGWPASFHAAAWLHLLLAAVALFVRLPDPPPRNAAAASGRLAWRALAPFAAVGFAYVGVEASLTVFAVPYATDGLGLEPRRGLQAISAFWLGLLLGRLAFLAAPRAADRRLLIGAGLAGAAALGLPPLLGLRALALHFALTGLCLGFVFPLLVALAGERFSAARGTAVGLVIGASNLGGLAVPWLHGALGDAAGPGVAVGSLALWALAVAVSAACARPPPSRS